MKGKVNVSVIFSWEKSIYLFYQSIYLSINIFPYLSIYLYLSTCICITYFGGKSCFYRILAIKWRCGKVASNFDRYLPP